MPRGETSRCTSCIQKRQRNQRSNCQHSLDHKKSKGIPEKKSTFASLTTLKPLPLCITKTVKLLKEMGVPDHLTHLLRKLHVSKEETEPDTEQQTGSKLGKEYKTNLYIVTLLI